MDLTISTNQTPPGQADASHVTWLSGGGLRVDDIAIMMTTNVGKLMTACTNSNEISVEAWITPLEEDLVGPARIATFSYGDANRSFSLVAQKDVSDNWYCMRLRTDTDIVESHNGAPRLYSIGFVSTGMTHLVFTHDAAQREALYVNGTCVVSAIRSDGGDFSTWDPHHVFALAEEISPPAGTLSATGELGGVALETTETKAQGIVEWEVGPVADQYLVFAPSAGEDGSAYMHLAFDEPSQFTVGTHYVQDGFAVAAHWEQDGEYLAEGLDATSGVVVISTATDARWAATYDLEFESEQHLAGIFDVPVLPTWGQHDGNPRTFYGEYYRAAIYSRALTEGEIRFLYTDRPK